ncbi:MAG: peptidase S8/S53 domain-containing protein [Benjaminiella poitrasii]|nr:MAG: peptidase S8/S53 domain-containing protein [Benjaminiella poitrasii]
MKYSLINIPFVLLSSLLFSLVKASQHAGYIVEFNSLSKVSSFIDKNVNQGMTVRYTYDSDLFMGIAVDFEDPKLAKRVIDSDSSILRSWSIHNRVNMHAPIPRRRDLKTSFIPQNKDTIRLLTEANYKFNKELESNGSGIKIGIIDTGVDYTHPALGGCFGKGCKIRYGYDLVGNDFDGSLSSIKEGDDPIDNCPINSTSATGHGTFVAGIIAAEDKEYNWTGVAPGATLGVWKVYGCNNPSSPNDVVLKAMEMAYKAGMDIINLSSGVRGAWDEEVLSVMADRLVSKGVHVVAASGNIGLNGIFLTASPASGKDVIAVGSTMNNYVPGFILKIYSKGNEIDIPYRTFVNGALSLHDKLPILATSETLNQKEDACKELHKNYNDSILLIHQGGCDSLKKIKHAKDAGAKAVVLYTNDRNVTAGFELLPTANLPVAFINNNDGELIFNVLKKLSKRHNDRKDKDKEENEDKEDGNGKDGANDEINDELSNTTMALFTNVLTALRASENDLDKMASFSSLGPTNELDLKPELVAVGANIFSTLPTYQTSYGFRSGTSFSAPYVSGSIALVLSNIKTDHSSPDLIKHMLMNFAEQVKKPISDIEYGDSPIRQGAGVVDVAQAIKGFEQFHVSPAKLNLNDSAYFKSDHELTIFNHGSNHVSIQVAHLPSLTVTGYSVSANLSQEQGYTPVEPVGLYDVNGSVANVIFRSTKNNVITIPGRQTAKVHVHFEPPNNEFSATSHVLYNGYLSFSTATTKASVPYAGMIGNMRDLPILDRSTKPSPAAPFEFPSIGLPSGNSTLDRDQIGHFHIHYDSRSHIVAGGPYVLVRLLTGTAIIQIQIVQDGQVVGDMPMTEDRRWVMRNTLQVTEYSTAYYSWYWAGDYVPKDSSLEPETTAEKKQVKSGNYQLKVRALRVFGYPEKEEDWDEWTSPRFKLDID